LRRFRWSSSQNGRFHRDEQRASIPRPPARSFTLNSAPRSAAHCALRHYSSTSFPSVSVPYTKRQPVHILKSGHNKTGLITPSHPIEIQIRPIQNNTNSAYLHSALCEAKRSRMRHVPKTPIYDFLLSGKVRQTVDSINC